MWTHNTVGPPMTSAPPPEKKTKTKKQKKNVSGSATNYTAQKQRELFNMLCTRLRIKFRQLGDKSDIV